LSSVLGRSAVSTFYYAIQERFNFPEKEFPQKPLEVLKDLEVILGKAGYGILEKTIGSEVRETFKVNQDGFDLAHVVEEARVNYLKSSL
jgi:hypothetical protein